VRLGHSVSHREFEDFQLKVLKRIDSHFNRHKESQDMKRKEEQEQEQSQSLTVPDELQDDDHSIPA